MQTCFNTEDHGEEEKKRTDGRREEDDEASFTARKEAARVFPPSISFPVPGGKEKPGCSPD